MPAIYGELSANAHSGWVILATHYNVTITALLEVIGLRLYQARKSDDPARELVSNLDEDVDALIAEVRQLTAERHRQRYDKT